LIAVTSTTFSDEPTGTELMLGLVLLVASLYVQIAVILAAGRKHPEPSADLWLRGALSRRCLWRFLGTSLFVVLGLAAGALLLVIGIFFVGALLAFAQSAAVLERRLPMDAVARSAKVATQGRLAAGVVFAMLILIPTVAVQTIPIAGWHDDIGPAWPFVLAIGELLTLAGMVALTRLFVAFGGEATPAPDRLAPAKPGANP